MIRPKNRFLFPFLIIIALLIVAAVFFAQSKGELANIPLPGIEGKRARCDDYEMVERLSFSYHESATHYSEPGILLDLAREAMLTPTPELCNGHVWLETPSPGD